MNMEQEAKEHQNTDQRIVRRRREFKIVIGALIVLVMAIIIFLAGMVVGRLQDRFNSHRMMVNGGINGQQVRGQVSQSGMSGTPFGTPGMLGGANSQRSMANANGAQGTITTVNKDNLIVNGNNGVSDTIIVTSSTVIRQKTPGAQDLKITDLHSGETITVLGDPNSQGQIVAKYIGVQ
jgi:hypothetical protein